MWPFMSDFFHLGFLCGSAGKESACNVGDLGSISGLGRSPGEGKGYPLQFSGLENSMDHIVHEVAKSQTWLSDFHVFISLSLMFSRFIHAVAGVGLHAYLWLNNIPLYDRPHFAYPFICWWTRLVSTFQQLWIMLVWIFACRYLCRSLFLIFPALLLMKPFFQGKTRTIVSTTQDCREDSMQ